MEDSMQIALMLMVVGMVTVFTILILVVLCSKLMIAIINRYFPEITVAGTSPQSFDGPMQDNKKVSVIIAAVEAITAGKGSVKEIKKINNK